MAAPPDRNARAVRSTVRYVRHLGRRTALAGTRFLAPAAPLDLPLLGRTLLHAAFVGGCAGALGALFFAALELGQRLLLEGVAGYVPLKAQGELLHGAAGAGFRPWLLAALPAAGGLVSGLLAWRFAPEAAGGGGDATIDAYHRRGGLLRARLVPVKGAASVAALATGGSGGREGPTMLIGAAVGSLVGRLMPTTARERRILVLAGVAAGISAVFRTPLGAALLAVELVYRDDFESDALVPAILASVVAYSVALSIFGRVTLFGRLPRLAFDPGHLPLYVVLGVVVSVVCVAFVRLLRAVSALSERVPAAWARPAIGGLAMGAFGTGIALLVRRAGGPEGLGVFGGGYGAVQAALSGHPSLPSGWALVGLFVALSAAKLVATALTIGSGASAGDFAPSLVVGGLLGAAFGHAAALVLHDPGIQPAAFALVGMGTFYGGIAHVPLSALVLVSELAGSYDLLVPMMLATGVAYLALRHWTLYPAQPATKRESPAHQTALPASRLEAVQVTSVAVAPEVCALAESCRVRAATRAVADARRQRVVVVTGGDGRPRGLVEVDELRRIASEPDLEWAVVADLALPWASVSGTMTLEAAGRALGEHGLPQLPVVEAGAVVGFVGEAEIAAAALGG